MSDAAEDAFQSYGLYVESLTNEQLLAEAEEWADGFGCGGLKGNQREMDAANFITVLASRFEALNA